jgi:hypothetical protein
VLFSDDSGTYRVPVVSLVMVESGKFIVRGLHLVQLPGAGKEIFMLFW